MKQGIGLLLLCLGAAGVVQAQTPAAPAPTPAAPAAVDAQQQTLDQASQDLQAGKGQAAYTALLPLVDQLAGTPSFDSLFGQAALAVHQDTRAAMAFERCLAVKPDSGNCRLGMAQAYMRLDEKQSAHDELVAIQQSAPPAQVQQLVQSYLGELSGASSAKQRFHAWASFALGYDNNTNVAPSSSTIALPGPSGFTGSFQSSTDSSGFDQGAVGMSYVAPVTEKWSLLAGANAQATGNFQVADNSYFDSVAQVGGYVGTNAHYGKQTFGVMLQAQNYQLGGENYRNLTGITAQYSYLLNAKTQLSGFLQHNALNYQFGADANLQNIKSNVLGASLAQSLMEERLVAFGGLYLGRDSKVESAANDNIQSKYVGLRGGATWLLRENWQAGANLLLERRNYDGKADFFPDKARKDTLASLDMSVDWQLMKTLSLNTKYTIVHNDSNVPIREYNRQIISLGVRYDFL